MAPSWRYGVAILGALALPSCTSGRHVLLDKVLSDNPPPGQSDASCAHLVRVGLDEGLDARGKPIVERTPPDHRDADELVAVRIRRGECLVEDAFQMEQRSITKQLNEIKSALQKGKPVQSISPAFEWAQSGDWIYINAKMSHKLDAPATLNVVSEGVQMTERSLKFAASKDHKRFSLDLALHADIDPDPSTVSFGSVGRVTFTLKKAKGGVKWPKLLDDEQKKPDCCSPSRAIARQYSPTREWSSCPVTLLFSESSCRKALATEKKSHDSPRSSLTRLEKPYEDPDGVKGAAASAAADSMSPERRLASEKKKVATALAKEKKSSRMEELEKEKRAVAKTIDADAAARKKEAEEALRAKKAVVEDEFASLVKQRHAELEAEHERSEL
ncbi:unnamed protein product [Scytosiphon promiscuus]